MREMLAPVREAPHGKEATGRRSRGIRGRENRGNPASGVPVFPEWRAPSWVWEGRGGIGNGGISGMGIGGNRDGSHGMGEGVAIQEWGGGNCMDSAKAWRVGQRQSCWEGWEKREEREGIWERGIWERQGFGKGTGIWDGEGCGKEGFGKGRDLGRIRDLGKEGNNKCMRKMPHSQNNTEQLTQNSQVFPCPPGAGDSDGAVGLPQRPPDVPGDSVLPSGKNRSSSLWKFPGIPRLCRGKGGNGLIPPG